MPADCCAKIAEDCEGKRRKPYRSAVKNKGIEGGFVLAYGGIEENCTLRAMFDAKRDELSGRGSSDCCFRRVLMEE